MYLRASAAEPWQPIEHVNMIFSQPRLWMLAILAAGIILLPAPPLHAGEKKPRAPNIIFILAELAEQRIILDYAGKPR